MVYGILRKLESESRLSQCSLALFREDVVNKREFIFGRDITGIDRSCVVFTGGETGREEFSIPLESIRQIEVDGRTVFRRKRKIEKIYPRKRH